MAGTAAKIAEACEQVLALGGVLVVDPQVAFLTGAHARILKDYGVVGHFKMEGVVLHKPAPTR